MNIRRLLVLFQFLMCVTVIMGQSAVHHDSLNALFHKKIYVSFNDAKTIALKAVAYGESYDNQQSLLTSYMNLGYACLRLKQNDSSLLYYNKALKLALKLNSLREQSKCYEMLGTFYKRKGDYDMALKLYQQSLTIAKQNHFIPHEIDTYIMLSSLYRVRGEKQSAFAEVKKALQMSVDNNLKKQEIQSCNTLGLLFRAENKDSSVYYYKRAINISKTINNKYLEQVALTNLGDLYIGDGKYQDALICLREAETFANQLGNKAALHYINFSLGIYYEEEIKDYDNAIKYYQIALNDYGYYIDEWQKTNLLWRLSGAYYFKGTI